jgi:hypothetical protein
MISRNFNRNYSETHNITNLDLSETEGGLRMQIHGLAVGAGYILRQNVKYTIKLKVVDTNGENIEDATIRMYDKNNNEIFFVNTYSNGTIPIQKILMAYNIATSNGINTTTVYWEPLTGGITLNPHTIIINKTGYELYNSTINITAEQSWTIALEELPAWNYSWIPDFKILNNLKHTIFKITEDGNLAIAGQLYENTNSPPPGVNIIWKIYNFAWLDDLGNLYLNALYELTN